VTDSLQDLIELTRGLGRPDRDLAVLAEGNTSARTGPDRMLVKASGSRMAGATAEDFVEVDTARLLALLEQDDLDQTALSEAMLATRVGGGGRPSIEALLHAMCIEQAGAQVVGHTHPVAANALLCSDKARHLVEGALFPDQVVVLGPHALLVPYADPGLAIAREVHAGLHRHIAEHGEPPKLIYLANHGIFALGRSAAEVDAITEMAVKLARVMSGVLAVGEPAYLPAENVEVLYNRPDEVHRRRLLSR
jgi:rhamnose utilization protein RhaD (predicted bifunctional aldolase and dehydrogenase)